MKPFIRWPAALPALHSVPVFQSYHQYLFTLKCRWNKSQEINSVYSTRSVPSINTRSTILLKHFTDLFATLVSIKSLLLQKLWFLSNLLVIPNILAALEWTDHDISHIIGQIIRLELLKYSESALAACFDRWQVTGVVWAASLTMCKKPQRKP